MLQPNLYKYLLFNADKLDYKTLFVSCTELRLPIFAKYLKNKFNDSRTIEELVELIKLNMTNYVKL